MTGQAVAGRRGYRAGIAVAVVTAQLFGAIITTL